MSIGIYTRISSHGQNSNSQLQWLTAHGHDLGKLQWFEEQETGSNLNRPAFNVLSEAIFSGSVKTVVVWKLDRIGRSMLDGINILSKWCECGVRVVSVTQQIDLSGTVGHLVAGVLFAIAEI